MNNKFSKIEMKIRVGWKETQRLIDKYFKRTSRVCKLQNWPEVKFSIEGDALRVDLNNPVALKNWPYKASSSKKKCHILIDGNFTCRIGKDENIELLSYCTRIGYFTLKSIEEPRFVAAIDGYHFDMEPDTQRAHPVFHAQRHEKVLINKLNEVGLELYEDPPESTLHHVHLPTPQIDLVSALIMVIADHIVCDEETENGFFDLARRARDLMPLKANLERQARLERCIRQQEMLLDHWYAPTQS